MIKKNILTLSYADIDDILDEHVINEEPFAFMVDAEIAEYIEAYLYEEFNIEDDEAPDSYDYDVAEYIITYLPPNSGRPYTFFIDEARSKCGKIRLVDLGKAFYYVFGDVSFNEARQAFGQEGLLNFCELEDYIDDYDDEICCEDCEGCDCELTDGQEEELKLILDYLEQILEVNGCPQCTYEVLLNATQTFKGIGRQDAKDYFRFCLDEID